ncbi:MAG: hypothetical protein RBT69_08300, partial [Spirochaetia bacterium]|nr:hypothetical protein [Spirochaetia bacterium]
MKKKNKTNNKKLKIQMLRLYKKIDLNIILLISTLLINSILLFLFLKVDTYFYQREIKDYEAGKVAERTITAEYDFEYVDKKSTSKRDYELERKITPVFKVYKEITDETLASFDAFSSRFKDFLDAKKDPQDLEKTFSDYISRLPDFNKTILLHLYEKPSAISILEIARSTLNTVMNRGIIVSDNGDGGAYQKDEFFEIWRWTEGQREKEDIRFSDALTRGKIKELTSSILNSSSDKEERLIKDIVFAFSSENCFYDFEETQRKRERVLLNTTPVLSSIKKGDVIVEKGFIITDSDMEIIKTMGSTVTNTNYRKITAILLYMISIYFLSLILFTQKGVIRKNEPGDVMLLLVLAELFFVYTLVVLKFFILPDWFNIALLIPMPLFTMVLSLVISQAAAINFAVVMSFIVLVAGNFSPYAIFFALLNGISGVFCVKKTETRIDLIIAGLKTGFLIIFFYNTLLFFKK